MQPPGRIPFRVALHLALVAIDEAAPAAPVDHVVRFDPVDPRPVLPRLEPERGVIPPRLTRRRPRR